MKHRNGILEKISKEPHLSNSYHLLLQTIDDYNKIYDLFHKTNEREIFRTLYYRKKSNIMVQIENNISKSTLSRYIKRYEYMALTLIYEDERFFVLKNHLINKSIR